MTGVRLVLYGIARVGWDENKSYTKGTSSKTSHKNVDVYLDETLILISRSKSGMIDLDYDSSTLMAYFAECISTIKEYTSIRGVGAGGGG